MLFEGSLVQMHSGHIYLLILIAMWNCTVSIGVNKIVVHVKVLQGFKEFAYFPVLIVFCSFINKQCCAMLFQMHISRAHFRSTSRRWQWNSVHASNFPPKCQITCCILFRMLTFYSTFLLQNLHLLYYFFFYLIFAYILGLHLTPYPSCSHIG